MTRWSKVQGSIKPRLAGFGNTHSYSFFHQTPGAIAQKKQNKCVFPTPAHWGLARHCTINVRLTTTNSTCACGRMRRRGTLAGVEQHTWPLQKPTLVTMGPDLDPGTPDGHLTIGDWEWKVRGREKSSG